MPREHVSGVDINYQLWGDGPPVLMLHGFTGSIGAWQGIPERLGERFQVIAIDLIGHGKTTAPDDPERYRIERAVEDLIALLDRFGVEKTAVLGYSMGGRVALQLASAAPERVTALLLESAAPGIDDPAEREARVESDERLARMIEGQGLETFIDFWESIPLFASQRDLPDETRKRQRELRLSQDPVGLANSLRGMGAGKMEPVADRLNEFTMPVLYLAGEHDEKYQEVGQRMVTGMPNAEYVEVPGAGHTVHLEQPEEYVESVRCFMLNLCHPEQP
jgi:2-succinyl-6-hydroxy-2,4-cyclohexadiene-1-carboxylate synthase